MAVEIEEIGQLNREVMDVICEEWCARYKHRTSRLYWISGVMFSIACVIMVLWL